MQLTFNLVWHAEIVPFLTSNIVSFGNKSRGAEQEIAPKWRKSDAKVPQSAAKAHISASVC